MENNHNNNEEEHEEREIFLYPRLFADFCRSVSLGTDDEKTGLTEVLLDDIFKQIDLRLKELMTWEEVEEEDMRVAIDFVNVQEDVKKIVIDKLYDLGYTLYQRVETQEEADHIKELSDLAEEDDDQLMRDILDEAFYKSTSFFIYW